VTPPSVVMNNATWSTSERMKSMVRVSPCSKHWVVFWFVRVTAGFAGAWLSIVMVMVLVVVFPAASCAVATRTCIPLVAVVVSQL